MSFNRDVRQILSDNCYACHGPDKNKREAELRLDDPASALLPRDGKPAIDPGKPDSSELIRRVSSTNGEERMPPESTGKALTSKQIETLRKWVQQGAKFEKHWSLIPPIRSQPPVVSEANWPRNEIDHFVLANLERQGVRPASAADHRTLVRRLHFDLVGLPPTSEVTESFVRSPSELAYENMVDQLLNSRHFGERMATYWLDIVRYADSAGYHSDNDRSVWPYRDYVIEAFNSNKPFDVFTREQLAGDLLTNATRDQRIASGYNRLLQTTEEGGAQPKEYSAKYQADRVRNTSVIWMASTMGCSECHDHKFDPFSTREFYEFAAFFADVQEKPVGRQDATSLPTAEQEKQLAELEGRLNQQRQELDRDTPEIAAAQKAWEDQFRARYEAANSWVVVRPEKLESMAGTTFEPQEDQSLLAKGENPDKDTYVFTLLPEVASRRLDQIVAIRLDALTHPSFGNKSLSRGNGNFVLSEIEIELLKEGSQPEPIKILKAVADFAQEGFPIEHAFDGKTETGWSVNGQKEAANRRALFVLEKPIAVTPGLLVNVRLRHESQYAKHNIGRPRFALTDRDTLELGDFSKVPADALASFDVSTEKRTEAQNSAVKKYFRSFAQETAGIREAISRLEQQRAQLVAQFPQSLVTVATTPRMVRILPRGNWLDETGEAVSPAPPQSLGNWKKTESRASRLELADWLTSPDHPLVSRVFVNRLWKLCFGQGLVKTLDDFGVQGEWPSHPELLDWLAVEFRSSGWNIKHMLKLMVMSRTYQQSSAIRKDLRDLDPTNRWLARQASFRLDAEFIRDGALSVSGLLVPTIGGPSVKPYQPAGYWRYLNFPVREWQNDTGAGLYRRGLYTHWQRTFLHPSLAAFDAPSREESCCERAKSNTPLQALALLNDPTFVEASRKLAEKTISSGGSSDELRLEYAFRQVLQRAPTPHEVRVLTAMVQKHREQFAADRSAALAIQTVGQAKVMDGIDPIDLAAWTSAMRVLFNLHETITRN